MSDTVRSVKVRLEAEVATYIARMKLAGRETDKAFSGLEGRLAAVNKQLDGNSKILSTVSKAERDVEASTRAMEQRFISTDRQLTQIGQNTRRVSSDINTFSGRLGLLGEAAITIGPALIPLGAATIPALTGLTAGLGAAAVGVGVAVLAFHGMGDALTALNDYQLDPTTDNLVELQRQFDLMGPSGAHFVQFIDSLGPKLHDLQLIARDGLLPGVEDGITDLLTLLPEVEDIVTSVSEALGGLAADAGAGLAGPGFERFFDYLQTDAAPTLEQFSHTLGNLARGFADLLVAFAPLSRDFTSGLESMSAAFADWAAGLDQTQGFQDFVAYVRQSGPQALDLIGSLADAIVGIVTAAAPVGSSVLPAMTSLLKVLAAIADSPIGPGLFAGIAAFTAFNRVAGLTTTTLGRLDTQAGTSATKLQSLGSKAAGIAAVGVAVGSMADGIGRIDAANLDRSLEALSLGDADENIKQIVNSLEELTATRNKVDLGEVVTVGGLFGDTSLDRYADNIDQVDKSLANLVESGKADEAAALFGEISRRAADQGVSVKDTTSKFDSYRTALRNAGEGGRFLAGTLADVGLGTGKAAGGATELTSANRSLYGSQQSLVQSAQQEAQAIRDAVDAMHDKRDANLAAFDSETQYRQALKDAQAQAATNSAGIRGNSDAALANRNSLSQLAAAWDNQSAAVQANNGKFREARAAFIDTATAMGVPARAAEALAHKVLDIPRSRVISVVAKTGNAVAELQHILDLSNSIKDKTVRLNYIVTQSNAINKGPVIGPGAEHAAGGYISGPGGPRDDVIPALLSNGEYVVNAAATARHRDLLDDINTQQFAAGGLVPTTFHPNAGTGTLLALLEEHAA